MQIQNIAAVLEFRLKVVQIPLLGDGGGGGNHPVAQGFVEGMGVEFLKILVGINGLTIDTVGHTDQLYPVFRYIQGSEIAIRVGKNRIHNKGSPFSNLF